MNAATSMQRPPELDDERIVAAFSGRAGGVSQPPYDTCNISSRVGDDPVAVLANRQLLLRELGLAGQPLVTVRQAHTNLVVAVPSLPRGGSTSSQTIALSRRADGIVTSQRGLALMVGVADCAPVIISDQARGVVCVLHVGWRGLLRGLVREGLEAVASTGGRRCSTVAVVGPSIGPCCLTVDRDIWKSVREVAAAATTRTTGGEPSLDLRAGIAAEFNRSGVDCSSAGWMCTAEAPEAYFSSRRDGCTGMQAAIVSLV